MAASGHPSTAAPFGGSVAPRDPAKTGLPLNWFACLLLIVAAATVWHLVTIATGGFALVPDEAQYWDWAQNPDFGYFSKPPLVAWAIAVSGALCGDGEFCVRLPAPLFHAVAAIFVGLAAHRLFGPKVGFWSGAAYVTSPGVGVSAILITTDAPLLMFWAIALFAFARAIETERAGWWLLTGLACGLGLLSKYAMGYFFLGAVVFFAMTPDRRRHLCRVWPWAGAGLAALIVLPNVVWNARHAFVTMTHVGDLASWSTASIHPLEAVGFIGSQFGVAGPLVFAAVLALGFRKSQWTGDWRNRLLLAFSMPILLLITVNGLLGNAYANWAGTAYVAAFVYVTSYWVRLNFRAAIVSLAINLIATAAIYYYGPITRAVSIQALAQLDPWERYRGWPEVGRQIGAIVSRTSAPVLLSDNRKDLVEFRYYVRPAPAHIVKWNPFNGLGDHYDLTTDIEPFADGPMVIATRYSLRYFRSFFCHNRLLGTVTASPRAGREQTYSVYLFEGFRGYDRKSRECRARPHTGEKR